MRRTLPSLVLAAAVLVSVAAPAASAAGPGPVGRGPAVAEPREGVVAKGPLGGRTTRPRVVVVTGTVTAVDAAARSLVLRRGGHGSPRSRTTTVVVGTAPVRRNGAPSTLAQVRVGDRATVQGVTAAGTVTVSRVRVSGSPAELPAPTA